MHIIVLGGAGAMGRIAVRTLSEYQDVDHITIADYNEERAHEVAATCSTLPGGQVSPIYRGDKIAVRQVDVNDLERLCNLLHGADAV